MRLFVWPSLDHDVVVVGVWGESQVPLASVEGLRVKLDAHAAVLAHLGPALSSGDSSKFRVP